MSEKKEYSALEAANKIAERLQEMVKSANSAHEIDLGEEPKNDDAECPPSLGGESSAAPESFSSDESEDSDEKEKKKKSEEGEDEALQGESDSDTEESESEEEAKPEKYDFKKSESGMFSVEYKRMNKAANPSFDREKKDIVWTNDQKKEIDRTKPGKIKSNRSDQAKHIEEAKKRREAFRKEGLLKEEVKETKGIDYDKEDESDKDKEQFKRPMEKGDGCKDCSGCEKCDCKKDKKSVEKLKKFMGKEKQPSPGMVQEPQDK